MIGFNIIKIWPTEVDRQEDKEQIPVGKCGLVSHDGNVYVSDGLNMTIVAGMQGVNGEVGEKGERGSTGKVGKCGKRGEKGDAGQTGTKGCFSMDAFETVIRPELESVVQGNDPCIYTLNVVNPVFSGPVWVYALSTLSTPSVDEIVNAGDIVLVDVDCNGSGKTEYVSNGERLWFTCRDSETVIGPFEGPSNRIGVNCACKGTLFVLKLDEKDVETMRYEGEGEVQYFEYDVLKGQSYGVKWVDVENSKIFVEPSMGEGWGAEGVIIDEETCISFECSKRVPISGKFYSEGDLAGLLNLRVTTVQGKEFSEFIFRPKSGPFSFINMYPEGASYEVSLCVFTVDQCNGGNFGSFGVIPEGGVNDIFLGCGYASIGVSFNNRGVKTFTLNVNGSDIETRNMQNGSKFGTAVAPGSVYTITPHLFDGGIPLSITGVMGTIDIVGDFIFSEKQCEMEDDGFNVYSMQNEVMV